MAKKKMEAAIYHGQIINLQDAQKHHFPIGCKFSFSNASYHDDFTVTGTKTEPGTEYRQVIGAKSGEVWMLLSSLQNEVASGSIEFKKQGEITEIKKEESGKKTKKR